MIYGVLYRYFELITCSKIISHNNIFELLSLLVFSVTV
jgi:hypothetical protein